jgi:integrase
MDILPEKFKELFFLLNESGLRISELINLKVSDITFKGKTKGKICVRKGKEPSNYSII